jgi:SMC interacting uncharacterized protein involved in chromosome segregation
MEDLDLSSFAQRYTDIKSERDMLRSQLSDLEKSHAVSESKTERLEQEVETLRAQIDSLKSRVIEKETIIQGIASTIVTHINKEKDFQPGVPARPSFTSRRLSVAQDNGLKAIEQSFSKMSQSSEPAKED